MDPLTIGLLAGGGLGLVKGGILDRDKERRQRKQEAEIARYSPWSGMQAQRVQEADPFGSMLQGGMTGAMMGSAMGAGGAAAGGAGASGAAGGAGAAGAGSAGAMGAGTGGAGMSVAQSSPYYMQQQYPWAFMR